MKRASLTFITLAFVVPGLLAACASGSETQGQGGAGGGSGTTTTNTTSTTATTSTTNTTSSTGSGQVCAPTCASDADCSNTCPAAGAGASNCCDLMTNLCYVANSSVCPTPNPTGGGGMPPY